VSTFIPKSPKSASRPSESAALAPHVLQPALPASPALVEVPPVVVVAREGWNLVPQAAPAGPELSADAVEEHPVEVAVDLDVTLDFDLIH
jgi:hypothetical protein